MSSHKRRQYPQQQYAAYEVPSGNAGAPAGAPAYGGYPGDASTAPDQGGLFVPGGAAAPTPPLEQVNQMNLNSSPYVATPGYPHPQSAPGYGAAAPNYAAGMNTNHASYGASPTITSARMPLNELFTVDLLQSMPAAVNNLDLPPPPLTVPLENSVTHSEYANTSPDYMRSTLNVVPRNSSVLRKSKLPFALVLRPFNNLREEDDQVPVVSDLCIARCRRCRSYINPFVQLTDNNLRWKCNICHLSNSIPQGFEFDMAESKPRSMMERAELNFGVVDYLASQEYLVRPPQPPTYVFLLDVSVNAVSVGALENATRTILDSLDRLPDRDGRTRVAFIGVDGALTFFQIPASEETVDGLATAPTSMEPRLLVVSDLEDPFLPTNSGLLVNLRDNRAQIEHLLKIMPQLYAGTAQANNALGSGLKAAFKLISNVGGKVVSITSSLPSVGVARLEQREDRKLAGTKNEHQLYSPANSFYKSFAVDCNRCNVSVDMFLISNSYQDVATLSNLPKFTGGATYFYPGWSGMRPSDVSKLDHELSQYLSQDFGQEGMLRVRSSTGIHSSSFSGHFFVRSSDLMTFPNVPHDQNYVVDLAIDENISKPYVTFQAALLYSSATGERKIRVMTMQVPVSDKLSDIYASADQQAIVSWYAHQASEKVIASGISATQDWMNARIAELLKTFRMDVLNTHTGTSGALSLCTNLSLLPLLMYAIKKNVALRPNAQILSDIRVHALDLLITLPTVHLVKYLYPDFYALHDMPEEAGTSAENGSVVLPERLNLTGESLQGHGLYLLDDGQVMFIWVGRDVVPQLLVDAFGTSNIDEVPSGKAEMPVIGSSDLNVRIRNIIAASRGRTDSVYYPLLYIVRDKSDPALRMWATALLVEDRSESEPTYVQYLNTIREKLTA